MPELPEVETVRRQLDQRLRGRTFASVRLLRSGRETPAGEAFVSALTGRTIDRVDRRAKLLVWRLVNGGALHAHLKMTGRFRFVEDTYEPTRHDRAVFTFDDGTLVAWSDMRQFGFVRLASDEETKTALDAYGPEPLDASTEELALRLAGPKTRNVKSALLNQEVIAGIGNIYADEALHRAGIRPTRRLGRMNEDDRLRLAAEIKSLLVEAVAQRGTSARNYADTQGEKGGFLDLLRVYGRCGQRCRTCGTSIERIVVAQRGTHYCAKCQT